MKKILIITLIIVLIITTFFIINKNVNKSPEKIAFFGDSITDYGWSDPDGYVQLTVAGLTAKHKNIIPIPAGICGNTSKDLLNRMDNDIINQKPDKLIVMIGLNDIWHKEGDINTYKENMTNIIKKTKDNHIKLILLNLTVTEKDFIDLLHSADEYNHVLKQLAKNQKIKLIDINSVFKQKIIESKKDINNEYILTTDGIHLNKEGNRILANILINEI